MYKISKNVRKYSSTPIVRVFVDDQGKEQEEIVCVCTGKKTQGDLLSLQIVKLLNQKETLEEAYQRGYNKGFTDGASDRCPEFID